MVFSPVVPELDNMQTRWNAVRNVLKTVCGKGGIPTFKPLLGRILSLRGRPYSIVDYFPFEPLFNTCRPVVTVAKAARQTSKTTCIAARGVLTSACIPYFNELYCTPLFETSRRVSTNYVRPFIDESPVKGMFVDANSNKSVLQRSLRNNSNIYFSYCGVSVTRIRGLSADELCVDETQDMDPDHFPIILETLSASRYKLQTYTGTPKALSGPLEKKWIESSQAEWVIRCQACGHQNVPSLDHDLEAMTGPNVLIREVSEAEPGVVCAKCGRPIYPRTGRWVHRWPERRQSCAGYHIPQLIMPMHYANDEAWRTLLGKRQGFGNTSLNVYYNECCGESYDTGARLVTETDLRLAATLHENKYDVALKTIGRYKRRVLAVDWGGGGEQQVSFTVAAVLGLRSDGKIDVIFGWRSRTPHDHFGEARRLLKIMTDFRCDFLVHDYTGAGATRETIMAGVGVPLQRFIPVAYVRFGRGPLMKFIPEDPNTGERFHYRLDKARSLGLTCHLIKRQGIRFFAYDFKGAGERGLLWDFLALTENKIDTRFGLEVYTIIRDEKAGSDDFAQAVNIGVSALYYQEGKWPSLSELDRFVVSREDLARLSLHEANWDWT